MTAVYLLVQNIISQLNEIPHNSVNYSYLIHVCSWLTHARASLLLKCVLKNSSA